MKLFSTLKLLFLAGCFISFGGCQSGNSNDGNTNRSAENPPSINSNSNDDSSDAYCETVYADVLKENEQDYVACLSDIKVSPSCPKPDGFDDGFKETLNIVIALDASGSMNGRISGKPKLDIAKEAITSFVNTLPERANVGLIVYGHRGSNSESQKQVSCAGVEPVYPIQKLDKINFLSVVNSFKPTGWTPLAGAIDKAGEVLKGQNGETATNLVYVVSDGIETCGGNPVEAAANLHQSEIKAVVNIIGFDVDNAAQKQLKDAATAGGGQYSDAQNAEDLNKIFGGVSKSVAQYNEYVRCIKSGKQDVYRLYSNKEAQIFSCVFNKLQTESRATFAAHQNWSRTKDPRVKCTSFVIEQQSAREKRIRNWRDEYIKKMREEKTVTYEELERELKSVTEKRAEKQ